MHPFLKWAIPIGIVIVLIVVGVVFYIRNQMSKLPGLSFAEALAYTTDGVADAVITVGVIKDGQATYTVYGQNAAVLPTQAHTYEIGSLTKTLTAALVARAANDGLLDLDATIDRYLDLPQGNAYPTIRALLTHTSGYRGFYFEKPMIANFFKGRNDFYGVTDEMLLASISKLSMDQAQYDFNYSNYGFAVLGLVLEAVHGEEYTVLLNRFVQQDLGLSHTKISDGTGDLGHYWDWQPGDAYLSAGAVTSDIHDMLTYARMQLDGDPRFAACHAPIRTIASSPAAAMGIHTDEIGMAWIHDRANGFIWHNGGTGHYNCHLGFDPETKTAVVILSNLAPNHRIPATVLGVKLLQELTR